MAAKRILVVDDEPSVLVTYEAILQRQGYEVVTALTYAEAIRALQEKPLDLVFTDFSLDRHLTGFDVIEFAKQAQPGVQLLMFTGYASHETAERAKAAGVPLLYKPLELPELFACLSKMLGAEEDETTKNQQNQLKVGQATGFTTSS